MLKKILYVFFLFVICSASVSAETVVFNSQNKKVHKVGCKWAKNCTKNCVKIERTEAYKKGGIKCKSCGG